MACTHIYFMRINCTFHSIHLFIQDLHSQPNSLYILKLYLSTYEWKRIYQFAQKWSTLLLRQPTHIVHRVNIQLKIIYNSGRRIYENAIYLAFCQVETKLLPSINKIGECQVWLCSVALMRCSPYKTIIYNHSCAVCSLCTAQLWQSICPIEHILCRWIPLVHSCYEIKTQNLIFQIDTVCKFIQNIARHEVKRTVAAFGINYLHSFICCHQICRQPHLCD